MTAVARLYHIFKAEILLILVVNYILNPGISFESAV
jgi:hypothetical protein